MSDKNNWDQWNEEDPETTQQSRGEGQAAQWEDAWDSLEPSDAQSTWGTKPAAGFAPAGYTPMPGQGGDQGGVNKVLLVLVVILGLAVVGGGVFMGVRYAQDRDDESNAAAAVETSTTTSAEETEIASEVEEQMPTTRTTTVTVTSRAAEPSAAEETAGRLDVSDHGSDAASRDNRLSAQGWRSIPQAQCHSGAEVLYAGTNGTDYAVICKEGVRYYYRGFYQGDGFEGKMLGTDDGSWLVDATPYTIRIRGSELRVLDGNGEVVSGTSFDTYYEW